MAYPQDIEWGLAEGKIHLLQSRPVTSIFPLPVNPNPAPLDVYLSFGAVQGMLGPHDPDGPQCHEYPLRGDGLRCFTQKDHARKINQCSYLPGNGFWIRYTPIIKNTVGRRVAEVALQVC